MGAGVLGHVHRPVLRPARPQGGPRPPARGGGPAARYLIVIALALLLQAIAADADTLDRQRYRDRLLEARAALVQARGFPPAARQPLIDRARALLRETTALRLEDGTAVAVDDRALADRVSTSDAALDAAAADIATLAELSSAAEVDARAADARLRSLVGEHRAREAQVSLIDLLSRWLARTLAGIEGGPPDARIVLVLAGGLGLALLLLVVAILGRDIRERFRREAAAPSLRAERGVDPALHLARAEEALRSGRLREGIHALYLYAIAALAAHEMIRYDPSLTDRELLARAGAVPHADALRDLIELHERIWYGLREARADEAARARALAGRAAA